MEEQHLEALECHRRKEIGLCLGRKTAQTFQAEGSAL